MPVTPAELEDAYLANTLVTLHRENWSVYGVHKLWHVARRQGLEPGRDQVARLMGIAGLAGVIRGRHTTRTTRREEGAPTPRPGPAELGRTHRPGPAVGSGLLLRLDAGGVRLRRLRRGRLLPPDPRLAGRYQHAHVPGHRRTAAGHRHPSTAEPRRG